MQKLFGRATHLLDALFLMLLGGYVFLGMTKVPFHGDESTFIRMSLDWAYIFEDHDPERIFYSATSPRDAEEQSQRLLTGSVDPLTIWLAWNIVGIRRVDVNGFWIWDSPDGDQWTYNVRLGNMPNPRLLGAARMPSTLFTSASIIIVFFIAWKISRRRLAAWIAAFLYGTTPSILVNGERAMQEGGMLLFTSLAILSAVYILQRIRSRNPLGWRLFLDFVCLGLAAGAAVASKHNAVLIIAPAFLAIFILLWFAGKDLASRERMAAMFRWLSGLSGSALLGFSVYYILTPVWWVYGYHWLILLCLSAFCFLFAFPAAGWKLWISCAVPMAAIVCITVYAPRSWNGIYQPVQVVLHTREELIRELIHMGRILPTGFSRIRELEVQLLTAKPQYYESYYWENLEEELIQIREYEDLHLGGRGGGKVWGIIVFVLAAIGACGIWFCQRNREILLLFLWMAVPTGILLFTNPLAFQRYYLFLIAPVSVLAGFAAVPLSSPEFWKRLTVVPPFAFLFNLRKQKQ